MRMHLHCRLPVWMPVACTLAIWKWTKLRREKKWSLGCVSPPHPPAARYSKEVVFTQPSLRVFSQNFISNLYPTSWFISLLLLSSSHSDLGYNIKSSWCKVATCWKPFWHFCNILCDISDLKTHTHKEKCLEKSIMHSLPLTLMTKPMPRWLCQLMWQCISQ